MISDYGDGAAAIETAASTQRERDRRAEAADERLTAIVTHAFARSERGHLTPTQLANHVLFEAMRLGRLVRRGGSTPKIDLPRDASGRRVNSARHNVEQEPFLWHVQQLAILAFTCGYRAEHEHG